MLVDGAAGRRDAARFIGRVGALAVALGIGVAVALPPTAYAQPTASDSTGTTSNSATAGTTDTTGPTDSAHTEPQQQKPETGEPAEAPDTDSEAPAADAPKETPEETPEDPEPTATPEEPETTTAVAASGAPETTAPESTADAESVTTDKPTATATDVTDSRPSDHSAGVDAVDSEPVASVPPTTVTEKETVPSAARSIIEETHGPVAAAATGQRVTDSIALVSSAATTTRAAARPADPVTTFVSQVVSLAAGLLSVVASQLPSVPVDAPFPWVLLAWVRRQFEETVLDDSPRIGFGSINTSQLENGVVTGTIATSGPSGGAAALRLVQGPSNGTVTIDPATGEFTYTPSEALAQSGGLDRFTVTVRTNRPPTGLPELIAGALGVHHQTPSVATVLVPILPGGDAGDDATSLDAVDLVRLMADGKVSVYADTKGAVRSISGSFTDLVVHDRADAAVVVNRVARLIGAAPEFADEDAISAGTLALGASGETTEVTYRLRPTVDGVPTVSSQVVLVTNAQGAVTGLFSSYDNRINDVDTTANPALDGEAVAVAAAHAALVNSLAGSTDAAATAAALAALTVSSDLVVYDVDPAEVPTLARRVTVYTTTLSADPDAETADPLGAIPAFSRTYYIHANGVSTGQVFAEISGVDEASAWAWLPSTKTVSDLTGAKRAVNGQYQPASGTWRFYDTTRKVSTYAASSTTTVPGTIVSKTWWTSWNKSAVSAQANTAIVFDYYRDTLGQLSYDDKGSGLRVTVLPNSYVNAYWDPSLKVLAFGGNFESALDVVGHEFTHGVVQYAVADGGGLIYEDESGALNESYADILGGLIENKTGSARWLIAEDRHCTSKSGCAIRDMSDPSAYGQPETYAARYLGVTDYGGVHTNSGIFNFAAYKMMTDSRTAAVTSSAWAHVFYGSLFKLSTNATFEDARAAILSTAADMQFTTSQRQAIIDAFDSVGISDF